MNIDVHSKVDKEDRPLTRADVEQLLHEVGSPDKLDLNGRNLEGVVLTGFVLHGANLSGADLSGADLSGADLIGVRLIGAKLREADLRKADLREADLSEADLSGADLSGADLNEVKLSKAKLIGAKLWEADLRKADLSGADLYEATLYEATLRKADLSGANLSRADLREADLNGADLSGATGLYTIPYMESREAEETASMLAIRINEEPLTAQNFTSIMSALTELHTKCWLISQDRFAELIEYTQTRNPHFVEEADLVLTRVRQNSFVEVGFSNLDPKNIADALVTAIDGVTQTKQWLKKAELENQEKAEQIRQAEQRAEQEYQAKQQELAIAAQKAAQESPIVQLEQEKQKFELERQRLLFQIELERQKLELERQQVALEKERLELFNKRMSYLNEIAGKMVDALQSNADPSTRAMLIQDILPDLLQLQNGKGLELVAIPAPQKGEENTPKAENG